MVPKPVAEDHLQATTLGEKLIAVTKTSPEGEKLEPSTPYGVVKSVYLDPKPVAEFHTYAEVRDEFKPIATAFPAGVKFTHLPSVTGKELGLLYFTPNPLVADQG